MTKEIIAQIRKIKKFHSDITDLDSGIHKGSWTKDDVNASELKGMSEMLDAVEQKAKLMQGYTSDNKTGVMMKKDTSHLIDRRDILDELAKMREEIEK